MNIHTITEILKGNAVSDAERNLELTEDSFLPGIVNEGQADSEEANGFTVKTGWRDYKRRCLPVTWLLLTAFCFFLKCAVYAVYWGIERIRCLFSDKKPERAPGLSPRVNLVLMLSVVIVYFMMMVSMLTFFIKDVLLFRPETYINDSGAICFPQSCKQEHYMYLLNAAECWSNTGIKVLKGDCVTVTASGSFFSRISEMDSMARVNRTLHYSQVHVLRNWQSDSTRPLWMYHEEDARFGSLLVQIKDDYEMPSHSSGEGKIIQLDTLTCGQAPHFRAKHAGVLNFAVNDIYLNEGCEIGITKLKDTLHLDFTSYKNVIHNYKRRPQMWYDDNVGEILLSIRVDRKDMNAGPLIPSCMARAYFSIDGFFFSPNAGWRLFKLILYLLLWLSIDYALGRCGLSLIAALFRKIKSTLFNFRK